MNQWGMQSPSCTIGVPIESKQNYKIGSWRVQAWQQKVNEGEDDQRPCRFFFTHLAPILVNPLRPVNMICIEVQYHERDHFYLQKNQPIASLKALRLDGKVLHASFMVTLRNICTFSDRNQFETSETTPYCTQEKRHLLISDPLTGNGDRVRMCARLGMLCCLPEVVGILHLLQRADLVVPKDVDYQQHKWYHQNITLCPRAIKALQVLH